MSTFAKIGTTKYIVRTIRDKSEFGNGFGPFVVRAESKKAAVAFVKRTWGCSWVKGFEVQAAGRFVPEYLESNIVGGCR